MPETPEPTRAARLRGHLRENLIRVLDARIAATILMTGVPIGYIPGKPV